MKNSKYLTLAAIAAATAMVSSCSDNDVLEGVKDTGIPFSVTASTNSGGSRGSDITTLSNFQLWGFGLDQDSHFDGDNFAPKSGSTTVFVSSDNTPNWPNTSNCLFYGISDNTSTMAYGVPAGSPGVNSTRAEIRNGAFTYTIPTSVVDQKDLLVAAATGNSKDGVQMKFDHALTAAKLKLVFDPTTTAPYSTVLGSGVNYGYVVKIKKIIIHNIMVSGTYNFNGSTKDTNGNYENGSWDTSSGTLGDYVIDYGDTPYMFHHDSKASSEEFIPLTGNIYFIPQTITPWNIKPNDASHFTQDNFSTPGKDSSTPDKSYSYIEFQAIAFDYCLEDISEIVLSPLVGFEAGWTNDDDGNFCYNGNIVARSDGFVIDFSNDVIQTQGWGEYQLYNKSISNNGEFSYLDNDEMYHVFYTPFKATLNVNGNRILKVSLDQGVIEFNGCSALFGVEGQGGAGS